MGGDTKGPVRALLSFLYPPVLVAVIMGILFPVVYDPPRPNLTNQPSKALVIASTANDDTSWLSQVPSDWTIYNYVTDAPTSPNLTVPVNRGNEAMVYLTYIIDHYDDLPDVILFHHSHDKSWHQQLDSVSEVTRLRPSYIQKVGYASLRCLPGCENIVTLKGAKIGNFGDFKRLPRNVHLATLLDAFLEEEDKGETVPEKLAAPCCAQFAVSREAVMHREREWWEDLRGWLMNTPLESINSGRLMEHTWHMWFGQQAQL